MAEAERTMDELPPPGDRYAAARRAVDRARRTWYAQHPELAPHTQG
ncbi:hypothetical protein [Streptomyces sp. CS62]